MFMTRQDLDEWLTALRSGAFPQSKYMLRSSSGYCCLGVLCELQARKGLLNRISDDRPGEPMSWSYQAINDKEDFSSGTLPRELAGRFKTNDFGPIVPTDFYKELVIHPSHLAPLGLAELNDYGLTFPEIADILEKVVRITDSYEEV